MERGRKGQYKSLVTNCPAIEKGLNSVLCQVTIREANYITPLTSLKLLISNLAIRPKDVFKSQLPRGRLLNSNLNQIYPSGGTALCSPVVQSEDLNCEPLMKETPDMHIKHRL